MTRNQREICKSCEHCKEGMVVSNTVYGRHYVRKCFYKSARGKALYNIDRCPKTNMEEKA